MSEDQKGQERWTENMNEKSKQNNQFDIIYLVN